MILKSNDKQFKLNDEGQITWQKDETNPLPGVPVATIAKGDDALSPKLTLIEEAQPLAGVDKAEARELVKEWLTRHLQVTLEPLFNLKKDEAPEGAPRDITNKLYDAMGILPRVDLEDLISKMDEETRATLRTKKIRFGPLLVFLPELNKPAAVRLRGLLLSLWQDKKLPAEIPADGIVSFSVEGKDIDKDYYRSIGYPVYGPRSIRVDMLDRVICAVYDSADKGVFQAQHKMAEWLGSNIADLYAVLEAMGHNKIKDPADEKTAEAEVVKTEEPAPVAEGEVPAKKEDVKPELATFKLKRGKAINTGNTGRPVYVAKDKPENKKYSKKYSTKKPAKKEARANVYTAEAKGEADNPFAILEQLKSGSKE